MAPSRLLKIKRLEFCVDQATAFEPWASSRWRGKRKPVSQAITIFLQSPWEMQRILQPQNVFPAAVPQNIRVVAQTTRMSGLVCCRAEPGEDNASRGDEHRFPGTHQAQRAGVAIY